MFNFLFRGRKVEVKPETKRERFERLVLELNEMLEEMPEKPDVTIHAETGRISFGKPPQFMDEALALPKPEAVPETPKTPEPPQVPDTPAKS